MPSGEEAWWEEVGRMKEERERFRKELQDARRRIRDKISTEQEEEEGADLGKDRTTCLLIGNHSAGKSSFVNWYVGEKIQVESVAMETAGFCLIRKGGKRARWKGRQTSSAFPWLRRASRMEGVMDFLSAEIVTSARHDMGRIEFIDTPGMVDGSVRYPYDVDQVVAELAEHSSVILVFLDPIGKALVSRCMRVVEMLSKKHASKMLFVLSKIDTMRDQHDRTNVVAQIAQELQFRVKASHAMKIHPMYIPSKAKADDHTLPNQIHEIVDILRRACDMRAQDVMESLHDDCKSMLAKTISELEANQVCVRKNRIANLWWVLMSCVNLLLFSLALYWFALNHSSLDPLLVCDDQHGRTIEWTFADNTREEERIPARKNLYCMAFKAAGGIPFAILLFLGTACSLFLSLKKTKKQQTMSPSDVLKLRSNKRHLEQVTMKNIEELRKTYVRHTLEED